ncbi:MAG TPA: Rieske 2Fe-2S domain-containing protein, partial [Planctomycetota bacterium]|nr:Rieske 2Fe-2S domain-containing protein [Planctomycetota bacterium]
LRRARAANLGVGARGSPPPNALPNGRRLTLRSAAGFPPRQESDMADENRPDQPATPPQPPTPPPAPSAAVPPAPPAAKPAPAPLSKPAAPATPVNPAALRPHPPKAGAVSSVGPTHPADATQAQLQRRRDFTWAGLSLLLLVGLGTFMRFFFPRTLFEPATTFVAGYPADYGYGVDTKFQSTQRVWVCRGPEGIYVISAVCTHLGCTPDWLSGENQFKCPCHGSVYDSEGRNFAGPAPRPMARCKVELNAEGRIVVDKLTVFEAPDFDKPGAYLPV